MRRTVERWHSGILLREFRTKVGWQQKELSDKARCRPETLSRWENGEMPGHVTMSNVARALAPGLQSCGHPISQEELYTLFRDASLAIDELAERLRTAVIELAERQQHGPPRWYHPLRAIPLPAPGGAPQVDLDTYLSQWLRVEPPNALLLIGEAGSGKTAALLQQLHIWARARSDAFRRLFIVPVFDIKGQWDPRRSPNDAANQVIARLLGMDTRCRPFERLREKYCLAFFFDGLDRAAALDRKSESQALASSILDLSDKEVLVLLSSRSAYYDCNEAALGGPIKSFRQRHRPQSLQRIQLAPLAPEHSRKIIHSYVDAQEHSQIGAQSFMDWLGFIEGTQDLMSIPFWLIELLELYYGDGVRDVPSGHLSRSILAATTERAATRLDMEAELLWRSLLSILEIEIEREEMRLERRTGELRDLLGRLACETFLQERRERQRFHVGSINSLLRAHFSEEEIQTFGHTRFASVVRNESGGRPRAVRFRHPILHAQCLAFFVRDLICRGDFEMLRHPELDRAFSAALRLVVDPECLQMLESELLRSPERGDYLELHLIHILLVNSLRRRQPPSDELLAFLRQRFPASLQRLRTVEPEEALGCAVGIARETSVMLDRWERPSRGRVAEFVRVIATVPEALLGLGRLTVRYFGSAPCAIDRLGAHLQETLEGSLEESMYGSMRLCDVVALYAVIRYHGQTHLERFARTAVEPLVKLLGAVREDSERRLAGDEQRSSPLCERSAQEEVHRLSCEWLERTLDDIECAGKPTS